MSCGAPTTAALALAAERPWDEIVREVIAASGNSSDSPAVGYLVVTIGVDGLVVNTASLCGFAGQFDGLQSLHERYGPKGVLILAVPSNDFDQELADEAAVKEYCAMTFDLTLPMTSLTVPSISLSAADGLDRAAVIFSRSG